ncbi:uncharacterized protein PAC_04685 [Phialocephala subalpina]|uniref:Uncharacterized protein n=1 Tax=Phialocephala subalpina TaxID=576137 RepID=A0A1L7WPY1_9HELO|nr:uncharacterized protein PAC_04685 [Phialocephala subalpina]
MQPAQEIFLEGVIRWLMVKINGLKATIEYKDEILEWNNETFCRMGFCATPDSTNPDSVDSSPLEVDAQVEGSCSEVGSQLEKIDELSENVDSTSEVLADMDSENSEPDSDIKGPQSQPEKAQFEIQRSASDTILAKPEELLYHRSLARDRIRDKKERLRQLTKEFHDYKMEHESLAGAGWSVRFWKLNEELFRRTGHTLPDAYDQPRSFCHCTVHDGQPAANAALILYEYGQRVEESEDQSRWYEEAHGIPPNLSFVTETLEQSPACFIYNAT